MGLINKLKDFFFDKPKDLLPENAELEQKPTIPEQKGETIGFCPLCNHSIGSDDRTRDLQGKIAHKRCVKKAQKAMLHGKSLNEVLSS